MSSPLAGPALGERTWTELAETRPEARPVLLVPLGSTEQHGPHLPIDTDTRIAVAVAELAAVRVRPGQALVAPALAYGASGEHQGFAGTLSIGQAALEAVVVELCRSVGDAFALIVLVNGHGGNAEPVQRALATLDTERRAVVAWWPPATTTAPTATTDSHAGRTETSLLLTLAPHLVRLDRAEAGVTAPLDTLLPELKRGGLAAVTANGVLGDPTGASAAEGRALLDALADDLAAIIGNHLADAVAEVAL